MKLDLQRSPKLYKQSSDKTKMCNLRMKSDFMKVLRGCILGIFSVVFVAESKRVAVNNLLFPFYHCRTMKNRPLTIQNVVNTEELLRSFYG